MGRRAFQLQLDELAAELRRMGVLVQEAIEGAIDALVSRNRAAAEAVIAGDRRINEAHTRIEKVCLEMLALQQPMASDLRRIAATLKVITDLERMADHAKVIARVVLRIADQPPVKPLVDIPAMADLAQGMVAEALEAFLNRDARRALAMIEKDHEVDRLHNQVIRDLERLMEQDPATVHQGIQLLFVSGALERIGDHATNLGEWLIYLDTGERKELNQ